MKLLDPTPTATFSLLLSSLDWQDEESEPGWQWQQEHKATELALLRPFPVMTRAREARKRLVSPDIENEHEHVARIPDAQWRKANVRQCTGVRRTREARN